MHLLLERLRISLLILVFALAGCSSPADLTEKEQSLGSILILPHHDVAAPMVEAVLFDFSAESVLILSPHHTTAGPPVITAQKGYDEKLTKLLTALGAAVRDDLISAEWGITELAPYFDGSRLAVCAVSALASADMLDKLASEVAALVKDGCVVIFSIDFSHGLSADAANLKDIETLALIMAQLPSAVKGLGSEHLDSPSLLYTAMTAANILGFAPKELGHANAADFIKIDGEVTSYFVIEWAALPA